MPLQRLHHIAQGGTGVYAGTETPTCTSARLLDRREEVSSRSRHIFLLQSPVSFGACFERYLRITTAGKDIFLFIFVLGSLLSLIEKDVSNLNVHCETNVMGFFRVVRCCIFSSFLCV